jgi:putative PIN family toxin of toxin-antitoxin system
LEEKLRNKARLSAAETQEILRAIQMDAEQVGAEPLSRRVCRDIDDDPILATALAAKADAIVTGDQDLLVLKEFDDIPILNPRECLAMVRMLLLATGFRCR